MSDEAQLMEAILAQPEDSAPRLAYAEWCRGQPVSAQQARADFIRTQLTIDTLKLNDPRWPAIGHHERELLDLHRTAWERPYRALLMPRLKEPMKWLTARLFGKGGQWGFRRGFIEDISASVIGFLDADRHLFSHTPVRKVKLTQATNYIPQLLEIPELDTLEALHLVSDAEFDEDLDGLLENALAAGLGAIELRIPKAIDGSTELFLRLKGEESPDDAPSALEDFPIWAQASDGERGRLMELANTPRFLHQLMEPEMGSEVETLYSNDSIYLGDLPRRAGIWANAKTFHDLPDDAGRCRRLLFYKPAKFQTDRLDEFRQSPYFVREHARTSI